MYQLINPCTCAVCTIQSVRLRESPSDLALQQSAALGTIWHIATNVRVDEMKWDCSNFCFFFLLLHPLHLQEKQKTVTCSKQESEERKRSLILTIKELCFSFGLNLGMDLGVGGKLKSLFPIQKRLERSSMLSLSVCLTHRPPQRDEGAALLEPRGTGSPRPLQARRRRCSRRRWAASAGALRPRARTIRSQA